MEDSQFAPVVVFVYNRPDHTIQLLNSINSLPEAKKTDLIVFSDGEKVFNDKKVKEVREALEKFRGISNFASYTVKYKQKNYGLASSIIEGVTEIINLYNKVIVLEDDLVVAKDFLSYMNGALSYYDNNNNIWSISGYTFPMKCLNDYDHDIYMTGRGCSWGWATWKNRWDTVDWEVSDYDSFKYDFIKRYKFGRDGRDLPIMLDAFINKEVKSWAIRWCYSAFLQHKLTVYPKHSKVLNKGTDGSGTNYTSMSKQYDTQLGVDTLPCRFEDLQIEKRIQKEFRSKYMHGMLLFKASARSFLIKLGLLKLRQK